MAASSSSTVSARNGNGGHQIAVSSTGAGTGGGNRTNLSVEVENGDEISVTRSGTLKVKGGKFFINSEGIVAASGESLYRGGRVRLEDLELTEVLGSGSSGIVHKAIHKPTKQVLALKDINVFEEAKRKQIFKELEALYASTCEHLVSFYGAFFSEGSISIALEYMDGGSIDDIYRYTGRIPEPILSKITFQVLKGLQYLHKERHVVHRDIKPPNLLMNSSGQFKITDFGVSAELDDSKASCGTFVGTVTYMSPERLGGEKYSYESDIWSLGLTVIECATADAPFKKPDGSRMTSFWELLSQIKLKPPPALSESEFSLELCSFVHECLNKSRAERPSSTDLLSHPFILKHQDFPEEEYQRWVKFVVAEVSTRKRDDSNHSQDQLSALLDKTMKVLST